MASSSSSNNYIEITAPETANEWEAYYSLRYRILRQPWRAPLGSEQDDLEDYAIHRIARDTRSGAIIGCARLHRIDAHTAQVRYMAVESEWRGHGIGGLLLESLEQWAHDNKISTIILNARTTATEFYLKHGYHIVGPGPTLYGAIKHVVMRKDLV